MTSFVVGRPLFCSLKRGAAVAMLGLAACASGPTLRADVRPRYLCGAEPASLSWVADRELEVRVVDAAGALVYASDGASIQEESQSLGSIAPAALPLTVHYGKDRSAQLDLTAMASSAWYTQLEPTVLEYGVYEEWVGESRPNVGLLPDVAKPASEKARCKERAENGQCLDLAARANLWEVGVQVRGARWDLGAVFPNRVQLSAIRNPTSLVLLVDDVSLPPGETLALDGASPRRIEAALSAELRKKCGVETRYLDGRCVASEGMTACRSEVGDGRLGLCAMLTDLTVEVQATCE